ncbi:unannotated protein [freshwater metagenome]|uniref:Unannotated protein n=1 Tax=freshwater metagenome TaxID=449393 RepID=A0A6J7IEL9_9ZZZZ|nr:hypothetical protein [Actinomycetota bacterium]
MMVLMRGPSTRTRLAALALTGVLIGALPASAALARSPLSRPTWLSRVTVTEYFPAPEAWFIGKAVTTPGLERKSRVDWLYSARGVAMEGDGIGLDGKEYHIATVGTSSWITARGRKARFGVGGAFAPFWRTEGFWRNTAGAVTFPLLEGGWFNGRGRRFVKPEGITFAEGPSRPLRFYRSVAVDRRLIPLGSLVYVPAYKPMNKDGWFRADDTGSAIIGRHLDVYRRPPVSSSDTGRYLRDNRIFVVPAEDVAEYVKAARSARSGIPPIPAWLVRAPR